MENNEEKDYKFCIRGEGFEFSPETDKIIPAFIKFQSEVDFAKKKSNNPFFNSTYADLKQVWSVISDPLTKYNLGIMQFPSPQEIVEITNKNKLVHVREVLITTMMIHDSNQWVKAWYLSTPSDNDHHSRGQAITFGRRYTIMALCGVCPGDDDGNQKGDDKKPEDKPKTDKLPPKAKKKEYQKDKDGIIRYNKTDIALNDAHQKQHGLVSTEQWKNIHELVLYNIGGNFNQFFDWLFDTYEVIFWDIKNEMVAGIMQTLSNNSGIIMDHKKCSK